MFGRFNRFNTTGSKGTASESAFCCASFNCILFVIDAVLAVSIFVCSGILSLGLIAVIGLCAVVLAILFVLCLITKPKQARPKLSAA